MPDNISESGEGDISTGHGWISVTCTLLYSPSVCMRGGGQIKCQINNYKYYLLSLEECFCRIKKAGNMLLLLSCTVNPQLTNLIHSRRTFVRRKVHKSKYHFPLKCMGTELIRSSIWKKYQNKNKNKQNKSRAGTVKIHTQKPPQKHNSPSLNPFSKTHPEQVFWKGLPVWSLPALHCLRRSWGQAARHPASWPLPPITAVGDPREISDGSRETPRASPLPLETSWGSPATAICALRLSRGVYQAYNK